MKIIEQPINENGFKQYKVRCYKCECLYEIENESEHTHKTSTIVESKCPNCGEPNEQLSWKI